MFLRYIDFIFAPFRAINNKIIGVRNIKGNFAVDVRRARAMKLRGQQYAAGVNQKVAQHAGGQQAAGVQPVAGGQNGVQQQAYQPGVQPMQQQGMSPSPIPAGMPAQPMGAPSMPGGAPNPNPPIRNKGFWIFAKRFCSQCDQSLDKTWDSCPYCAQIAVQASQAPEKLQKLKTQAFVLDSSGSPGSMQMLGWLVPLGGPQRGELYTLQPKTVIGSGKEATVVLSDKYLSSTHAEIVAENGMWVLRDGGSTNGTWVNNRRVDRHELVDNDFIKFGNVMVKFKSLL